LAKKVVLHSLLNSLTNSRKLSRVRAKTVPARSGPNRKLRWVEGAQPHVNKLHRTERETK
jgi:hypothetical protein